MANEVEVSKSFQEKMFEQIRDKIGELMTDEDLKAIVATAVNRAFFEPVQTKNNWGRDEIGEPYLVSMLRKELSERVTIAVRDWLAAHPDEVTKVIDDIVAKGMLRLIQQHIDSITALPLQAFADQLRQKGLLGY